MGFDWKATLKTVAPTLATALGGPLAGTAVKLLGDKVLGKTDAGPADEEAIAAVVSSGDPEVLLKLKEAEQDFQLQLKKLDIEREKLVYDDRDSARRREMSVKDFMPKALGLGIVISFLVFVVVLLAVPATMQDREVIFLIIGNLSGWVSAVFTYYFGSSSGSAEKNKMIDKVMGSGKTTI